MPKEKSLLNFINENIPDKLQVEEDLGWGYVRLNITEAHKRQAKDDIGFIEDAVVELLRNSRDANSSHIYIATWKNNNIRNILMMDDGEGIPDSLQSKIFEPRVTSKLNKINYDHYGLHGRGMALYSIYLNSVEAKVIFSKTSSGTIIKTVFDTNMIKEKVNQSTWPKIGAQKQLKDGPNNIIRRCLEFNLKNKKIKIFLGSPVEILSKLYQGRLFGLNNNSAKMLHKKALDLGLETSLRNCQRIVYGEIKTLQPILDKVACFPTKKSLTQSNKTSLFFEKKDLQSILENAKSTVNAKGKEYFLRVSEDANINRVGNKLKIILPLETEE